MTGKQKKKGALRVLVALVSVAMVTGFVILFIAASKDRSQAVCTAMRIEVEESGAPLFVNTRAIKDFISQNRKLNPVGRKLRQLNTALLEESVKTFPWVKDAELYVDNNDILRIRITQCVPVARIFTRSGHTFYVDREGTHLPVTGNFAADLPVFTGFPTDVARPDSADSVLFAQVLALSSYICARPFWKAQISQVNILADRHFELIPVVGDQLIEFGSGDRIEDKFSKLMAFYQGALNNVGWGYYDTLNLAYAGQVIASRKGNGNPVIDSLLTDGGYGNADAGSLTMEHVLPPVDETLPDAKQPEALYRGPK